MPQHRETLFFPLPAARHTYEQYFHLNRGALTVTENAAEWRGKKAAARLLFLGDVMLTAEKEPYSRDYNLLCEGYGKALVFTPEAPDGICLAW